MWRKIAGLALVLASSVASASTADSCNLSMYPVGSDGQRTSERFIGPDDVASIDYDVTDRSTSQKQWRVTLNQSGAEKNLAYTRAHVGENIAVLCDSREVSRAKIDGVFSNNFVVALADPGK